MRPAGVNSPPEDTLNRMREALEPGAEMLTPEFLRFEAVRRVALSDMIAEEVTVNGAWMHRNVLLTGRELAEHARHLRETASVYACLAFHASPRLASHRRVELVAAAVALVLIGVALGMLR